MRKLFASTALALTLICFNVALAYTNPGQATGFVNDFANILQPDQKLALEQKLNAFEQNTGNEISVVTIKSLDGDTVENFAEKLFQEWGIGKEREDNGILLLIALDDREMRIEVGYGLEGSLTDILSSRIIRYTLTPSFQQGDFYGGINKATDEMIYIIGGTVPENLSSEEKTTGEIFDQIGPLFIFLLLFGFNFLMIVTSILSKSKSWWAGGVMGFVIAVILGLIFTFWVGLIAALVLTPLGLLFDFLVSRSYKKSLLTGSKPWWMRSGGGRGFGGGGGFGGFGGGSSGGGGASGRW